MTVVILNPGTGPVVNASETLAAEAALRLSEATGLQRVTVERNAKADHGDGRYSFLYSRDGIAVDVDIPGVSMEALTAGPWKSPRLYVDGSSWLWEYAVSALRDALLPASDE